MQKITTDKYILINPNHHAGMFSYVWESLKMIHLNLTFDPFSKFYIDFSESIYLKKHGDNVWDCFFKQPCVSKKPEINEIEFISDTVGNGYGNYYGNYYSKVTPSWIDSQLNYIDLRKNFQEKRKIFNSLIEKYVVLNSFMENKMKQFYDENFLNKKILGVHIRKTDHPNQLDDNFILKEIEKYINLYDSVFVASDSQEICFKLKTIYGSKIILYDSIKSSSSCPVHHYRPHAGDVAYKTGEDVIIESHLLSKSDLLLCFPLSNVNSFAIYKNLNLPFIVYSNF